MSNKLGAIRDMWKKREDDSFSIEVKCSGCGASAGRMPKEEGAKAMFLYMLKQNNWKGFGKQVKCGNCQFSQLDETIRQGKYEQYGEEE